MRRSYYVETWGCQMNRHDSERIEWELSALGLVPAQSAFEADLVVLNTCSVREKPVLKLRSRLAELKRAGVSAVVVCGCVAQQMADELLEVETGLVKGVVGPRAYSSISKVARAALNGETSCVIGWPDPDVGHDPSRVSLAEQHKARITIIEGCNEFCTFCVVPYTRGRESSRPLRRVLEDVEKYAASGIKEIELLGQTINSYRCPETGASFADLLDEVAALVGRTVRVRFITSHPRHFGDDLIEVLAKHPYLAAYLHLPVQSGSSKVLRRMRRRYTREDYLRLVEKIRAAVPEVNLSTDFIVGFPGEDEEDFKQTIDLLREVRFGQVFAFAFSPRPRTPAATYPDQVPVHLKRERLRKLLGLADRTAEEENRKLIGKVVEVLVEGGAKRPAGWLQGRSLCNRVVLFDPQGKNVEAGSLLPVAITWAGPHSLKGEVVLEGASLTTDSGGWIIASGAMSAARKRR